MNLSLRATAGDLPEFDDAEDAADNGRIEANYRRLGPSIIVKDSKIGKASDFWGRYKEDIQRAKDLGKHPPPWLDSAALICFAIYHTVWLTLP